MAKNKKENEDSKRFTKIDDIAMDNEAFRIICRGNPLVLLHRLMEFVVRKPFIGDLGLYEKYYKKGLLASSITTRKLAKDFNYASTCQIRKDLDDMEKYGWIKKDTVVGYGGKEQSVFILGTHGNTEPGIYENNFWYYLDTLDTLHTKLK
jgi:hypothetical protein